MESPNKQTAITEQQIRTLAQSIGFDDCGVSKADFLYEDEYHLRQWLCNNYHGEMGFMEKNIQKRLDPRALVPNAKSIISTITHYYPGDPDISVHPPKISRYALGKDYHTILKHRLFLLFELIQQNFGKIEGRVFVDSAPVLEKSWAVRSGMGWIGKNSLLIHPQFGSYIFIGEIISNLEIEINHDPYPNRCGSCNRCLDACPTSALVAPRIVNASKCISYLTIEKKSPLTKNEKEQLSGWCYGCDVCQQVCPWNSKTKITKDKDIQANKDVLSLSSDELKSISKERFEKLFADSPILRMDLEKVLLLLGQ